MKPQTNIQAKSLWTRPHSMVPGLTAKLEMDFGHVKNYAKGPLFILQQKDKTLFLPVAKFNLCVFVPPCHNLQDSTPKWSRRGWIRHVLDEMKLNDLPCFEKLQSLLSRAGAASEVLGETIDTSLHAWKSSDIFAGAISVGPLECSEKTDEKTKKTKELASMIPVHYPASKVSIVVLKMPVLFKLSQDFQSKVQSLMEDFREIAGIWNEAIQRQDANSRPPDEEEEDHDQPGSCPLQAIRICNGPFEMGPFILGRGTCVAMNAEMEVERLLKGQLPARKALKHLWDCVARARREYHWGTMHKSCPFLYAPALAHSLETIEDH